MKRQMEVSLRLKRAHQVDLMIRIKWVRIELDLDLFWSI